MDLLVKWFVYAVAFWLTARLLPGFKVEGFVGAIVASALFGVLNVLIGWLLFGMIGIATLGIGFLLGFVTQWIVNAILLQLASAFTHRMSVSSFGNALLASFCIAALCEIARRLMESQPLR